jgi:hypothetical protein
MKLPAPIEGSGAQLQAGAQSFTVPFWSDLLDRGGHQETMIRPLPVLRGESRQPRERSLDEVLGVRPDFIEHQLAHAVRDPNGRVYNRTAHLPERRKMMQLWADYLDELKSAPVAAP